MPWKLRTDGGPTKWRIQFLLTRSSFIGRHFLELVCLAKRSGPAWFSCALDDKGETDSNPILRPFPSAAAAGQFISDVTVWGRLFCKLPAPWSPYRWRPAICMPTKSGRRSGRRPMVNLENDVFERTPVRSHLPGVGRQFSPIMAQAHWTRFHVTAQIDWLHLSILELANCDIRWT